MTCFRRTTCRIGPMIAARTNRRDFCFGTNCTTLPDVAAAKLARIFAPQG